MSHNLAWACTQCCICTHPSKSSAICQSISKYPMDIYFPNLTFKLCLGFCLLQLVPQSLAALVLISCSWFFLKNTLGKGPFLRRVFQVKSQIDNTIRIGLFYRATDRTNGDNAWEQGFIRCSKFGLSLPIPARLLVFIITINCKSDVF